MRAPRPGLRASSIARSRSSSTCMCCGTRRAACFSSTLWLAAAVGQGISAARPERGHAATRTWADVDPGVQAAQILAAVPSTASPAQAAPPAHAPDALKDPVSGGSADPGLEQESRFAGRAARPSLEMPPCSTCARRTVTHPTGVPTAGHVRQRRDGRGAPGRLRRRRHCASARRRAPGRRGRERRDRSNGA